MTKCTRCRYDGPAESFPLKKNGLGRLSTCSGCTKKVAGKNAKRSVNKTESNKENVAPTAPPPSQLKPITDAAETISLAEAKKQMKAARRGACRVDAFVRFPPEHAACQDGLKRKERAQLAAGEVREATEYRFK